MPIRITCPSCSASLSVRDEFAGRAVKCPKCAGIIPPVEVPPPTASEPDALATLPPPPPPPPAPEPMDLPDEPAEAPPPPAVAPAAPARSALDEPEGPAKNGSKVTPRPAARAEDDEDEDDRPRRKRRDEDDDRDERSRKRRDEDDRDEPRGRERRDEDEDDDRPRRKRRDDDRDERSRRRRDEDDDRPRRKRRDEDDVVRPTYGRRPQQSSAGAIVIIVGALLLLVGGGALAWYALSKSDETTKDKDSDADKRGVSRGGYDDLKVGTATRKQAEDALGAGKAATVDDIEKAFPGDAVRVDKWSPLATRGRALIWRSGDDVLLAGFHPSADPDARLQLKEWKPKAGTAVTEGDAGDYGFLAKYPPARTDDLSGPAVEATVEQVARDYGENNNAADAKYKGKVVSVEGPLEDIELKPDTTMTARLGAPGGPGVRVTVWPGDMNKVFACSRVQTVKFKGRCNGLVAGAVEVTGGKFDSKGTDPAFFVTASRLIGDYANDGPASDGRYRDKQLTVADGVVESKTPDAVYLIAAGKAKFDVKIRMSLTPEFRKQFDGVRVGALVRVKGQGGGLQGGFAGGEFHLNRGWLVTER